MLDCSSVVFVIFLVFVFLFFFVSFELVAVTSVVVSSCGVETISSVLVSSVGSSLFSSDVSSISSVTSSTTSSSTNKVLSFNSMFSKSSLGLVILFTLESSVKLIVDVSSKTIFTSLSVLLILPVNIALFSKFIITLEFVTTISFVISSLLIVIVKISSSFDTSQLIVLSDSSPSLISIISFSSSIISSCILLSIISSAWTYTKAEPKANKAIGIITYFFFILSLISIIYLSISKLFYSLYLFFFLILIPPFIK